MSSNNLREDMCMLCRDIGKDLSKFNVNVIAVENIINNGFTHFRIEDAQSNGSNPVISAPFRGILNEKWCNKSYDSVINFDEMELIEEKMDEMIYYYQFIKAKFKKGRLIREKIEEKEKEK